MVFDTFYFSIVQRLYLVKIYGASSLHSFKTGSIRWWLSDLTAVVIIFPFPFKLLHVPFSFFFIF
jgi:integral membrane sensor domain MASE1